MRRRFCILVVLATAIAAYGPAAPAQQGAKVHRVGFLTALSANALKSRLDAFREELKARGYVEGRNLVIVERYASGQRKKLRGLAAELLERRSDVIVVHGDSIARIVDVAATKAGRAVPIVLGVAGDPVGTGLVASLAKPGGNVTGVTSGSDTLVGKRLQLIKEVIPSSVRIAVLLDSRIPVNVLKLKTLNTKAPGLGVTLFPVQFAKSTVGRAFDRIRRERPDALHVFQWGLVMPHFRNIAEFALKNRLPAVGGSERFARAGGLMAYSVDGIELYRRAASYVAKILEGAKPADLPIEQPKRFKLTVNLKTARAIGVTIPRSLLLRADEVIE